MLLADSLKASLAELDRLDPAERRRLRRSKFRAMGVYLE